MPTSQDKFSVEIKDDYSPTPATCFPSYLGTKDNLSLSSASVFSTEDGGSVKPVSEWTTKACVTTLGASLALFCTFGQMNSFGTFQTWYMSHELSLYEQSTISWIGSTQLSAFFVSGWPIGVLFDNFGPRPLLIAGSFVHIISLVATSFAQKYWHFVLGQGLFFGFGVGLMFYPSLSACSTHFTRYRATALGIAGAGSGVGGIIYPIVMRRLFTLVGFSWAVRYTGIISLVFCIIAVMTVSQRRREEDALQQPWREYFRWRIISDVPFMLLAVGCCLVALALFIPYFYLASYARSISVSSTLSFDVLAVLNAGSVIGRILPSCIADRMGRFNLFAPAIFLCGFSCLVIWMFAKTLAILMVFACVYGFASGAFISLITPCVVQISKREEIGSRIGALYTLVSIPSICGGPIAGALLSAYHGSYASAIAFTGSVLMAGAITVVWAKMSIIPRFFAVV